MKNARAVGNKLNSTALDSTAPAAPKITNTAAYDQDGSLTLTVTGEAGSRVTVYDAAGLLVGIATEGRTQPGLFTIPVSGLIGSPSFTAKATDAAGNTSGASGAYSVTVDGIAPAVAITSTGGTTNQAIQSVSGTGEAGTIVEVYDNGGRTAIGQATVDNTGHWSTSITFAVQGTHSLVARATDAAGNVGSSSAVTYDVDTLSYRDTLVDYSWYSTYATDPYSVTYPDQSTLRLELRSGDHAPWDATCDLAGLDGWARMFDNASTTTVDYGLTISGDAIQAQWILAGEFHNNDGQVGRSTNPPLSIHLEAGVFSVWAVDQGATRADDRFMRLFQDDQPIVFGREYDFHIEANFQDSPAGFVEIFLDGEQIVNYQGPIGAGVDTYWMPDVYRSASTETTIVEYRNLHVYNDGWNI